MEEELYFIYETIYHVNGRAQFGNVNAHWYGYLFGLDAADVANLA